MPQKRWLGIATLWLLALATAASLVGCDKGRGDEEEAAQLAAALSEADLALGTQLFQERCNNCHGPDGRPTEMGQRFNAADLGDGLRISELGAGGVQDAITRGRNNMPAQGNFDAHELASITAFVLSLSE